MANRKHRSILERRLLEYGNNEWIQQQDFPALVFNLKNDEIAATTDTLRFMIDKAEAELSYGYVSSYVERMALIDTYERFNDRNELKKLVDDSMLEIAASIESSSNHIKSIVETKRKDLSRLQAQLDKVKESEIAIPSLESVIEDTMKSSTEERHRWDYKYTTLEDYRHGLIENELKERTFETWDFSEKFIRENLIKGNRENGWTSLFIDEGDMALLNNTRESHEELEERMQKQINLHAQEQREQLEILQKELMNKGEDYKKKFNSYIYDHAYKQEKLYDEKLFSQGGLADQLDIARRELEYMEQLYAKEKIKSKIKKDALDKQDIFGQFSVDKERIALEKNNIDAELSEMMARKLQAHDIYKEINLKREIALQQHEKYRSIIDLAFTVDTDGNKISTVEMAKNTAHSEARDVAREKYKKLIKLFEEEEYVQKINSFKKQIISEQTKIADNVTSELDDVWHELLNTDIKEYSSKEYEKVYNSRTDEQSRRLMKNMYQYNAENDTYRKSPIKFKDISKDKFDSLLDTIDNPEARELMKKSYKFNESTGMFEKNKYFFWDDDDILGVKGVSNLVGDDFKKIKSNFRLTDTADKIVREHVEGKQKNSKKLSELNRIKKVINKYRGVQQNLDREVQVSTAKHIKEILENQSTMQDEIDKAIINPFEGLGFKKGWYGEYIKNGKSHYYRVQDVVQRDGQKFIIPSHKKGSAYDIIPAENFKKPDTNSFQNAKDYVTKFHDSFTEIKKGSAPKDTVVKSFGGTGKQYVWINEKIAELLGDATHDIGLEVTNDNLLKSFDETNLNILKEQEKTPEMKRAEILKKKQESLRKQTEEYVDAVKKAMNNDLIDTSNAKVKLNRNLESIKLLEGISDEISKGNTSNAKQALLESWNNQYMPHIGKMKAVINRRGIAGGIAAVSDTEELLSILDDTMNGLIHNLNSVNSDIVNAINVIDYKTTTPEIEAFKENNAAAFEEWIIRQKHIDVGTAHKRNENDPEVKKQMRRDAEQSWFEENKRISNQLEENERVFTMQEISIKDNEDRIISRVRQREFELVNAHQKKNLLAVKLHKINRNFTSKELETGLVNGLSDKPIPLEHISEFYEPMSITEIKSNKGLPFSNEEWQSGIVKLGEKDFKITQFYEFYNPEIRKKQNDNIKRSIRESHELIKEKHKERLNEKVQFLMQVENDQSFNPKNVPLNINGKSVNVEATVDNINEIAKQHNIKLPQSILDIVDTYNEEVNWKEGLESHKIAVRKYGFERAARKRSMEEKALLKAEDIARNSGIEGHPKQLQENSKKFLKRYVKDIQNKGFLLNLQSEEMTKFNNQITRIEKKEHVNKFISDLTSTVETKLGLGDGKNISDQDKIIQQKALEYRKDYLDQQRKLEIMSAKMDLKDSIKANTPSENLSRSEYDEKIRNLFSKEWKLRKDELLSSSKESDEVIVEGIYRKNLIESYDRTLHDYINKKVAFETDDWEGRRDNEIMFEENLIDKEIEDRLNQEAKERGENAFTRPINATIEEKRTLKTLLENKAYSDKMNGSRLMYIPRPVDPDILSIIDRVEKNNEGLGLHYKGDTLIYDVIGRDENKITTRAHRWVEAKDLNIKISLDDKSEAYSIMNKLKDNMDIKQGNIDSNFETLYNIRAQRMRGKKINIGNQILEVQQLYSKFLKHNITPMNSKVFIDKSIQPKTTYIDGVVKNSIGISYGWMLSDPQKFDNLAGMGYMAILESLNEIDENKLNKNIFDRIGDVADPFAPENRVKVTEAIEDTISKSVRGKVLKEYMTEAKATNPSSLVRVARKTIELQGKEVTVDRVRTVLQELEPIVRNDKDLTHYYGDLSKVVNDTSFIKSAMVAEKNTEVSVNRLFDSVQYDIVDGVYDSNDPNAERIVFQDNLSTDDFDSNKHIGSNHDPVEIADSKYKNVKSIHKDFNAERTKLAREKVRESYGTNDIHFKNIVKKKWVELKAEEALEKDIKDKKVRITKSNSRHLALEKYKRDIEKESRSLKLNDETVGEAADKVKKHFESVGEHHPQLNKLNKRMSKLSGNDYLQGMTKELRVAVQNQGINNTEIKLSALKSLMSDRGTKKGATLEELLQYIQYIGKQSEVERQLRVEFPNVAKNSDPKAVQAYRRLVAERMKSTDIQDVIGKKDPLMAGMSAIFSNEEFADMMNINGVSNVQTFKQLTLMSDIIPGIKIDVVTKDQNNKPVRFDLSNMKMDHNGETGLTVRDQGTKEWIPIVDSKNDITHTRDLTSITKGELDIQTKNQIKNQINTPIVLNTKDLKLKSGKTKFAILPDFSANYDKASSLPGKKIGKFSPVQSLINLSELLDNSKDGVAKAVTLDYETSALPETSLGINSISTDTVNKLPKDLKKVVDEYGDTSILKDLGKDMDYNTFKSLPKEAQDFINGNMFRPVQVAIQDVEVSQNNGEYKFNKKKIESKYLAPSDNIMAHMNRLTSSQATEDIANNLNSVDTWYLKNYAKFDNDSAAYPTKVIEENGIKQLQFKKTVADESGKMSEQWINANITPREYAEELQRSAEKTLNFLNNPSRKTKVGGIKVKDVSKDPADFMKFIMDKTKDGDKNLPVIAHNFAGAELPWTNDHFIIQGIDSAKGKVDNLQSEYNKLNGKLSDLIDIEARRKPKITHTTIGEAIGKLEPKKTTRQKRIEGMERRKVKLEDKIQKAKGELNYLQQPIMENGIDSQQLVKIAYPGRGYTNLIEVSNDMGIEVNGTAHLGDVDIIKTTEVVERISNDSKMAKHLESAHNPLEQGDIIVKSGGDKMGMSLNKGIYRIDGIHEVPGGEYKTLLTDLETGNRVTSVSPNTATIQREGARNWVRFKPENIAQAQELNEKLIHAESLRTFDNALQNTNIWNLYKTRGEEGGGQQILDRFERLKSSYDSAIEKAASNMEVGIIGGVIPKFNDSMPTESERYALANANKLEGYKSIKEIKELSRPISERRLKEFQAVSRYAQSEEGLMVEGYLNNIQDRLSAGVIDYNEYSDFTQAIHDTVKDVKHNAFKEGKLENAMFTIPDNYTLGEIKGKDLIPYGTGTNNLEAMSGFKMNLDFTNTQSLENSIWRNANKIGIKMKYVGDVLDTDEGKKKALNKYILPILQDKGLLPQGGEWDSIKIAAKSTASDVRNELPSTMQNTLSEAVSYMMDNKDNILENPNIQPLQQVNTLLPVSDKELLSSIDSSLKERLEIIDDTAAVVGIGKEATPSQSLKEVHKQLVNIAKLSREDAERINGGTLPFMNTNFRSDRVLEAERALPQIVEFNNVNPINEEVAKLTADEIEKKAKDLYVDREIWTPEKFESRLRNRRQEAFAIMPEYVDIINNNGTQRAEYISKLNGDILDIAKKHHRQTSVMLKRNKLERANLYKELGMRATQYTNYHVSDLDNRILSLQNADKTKFNAMAKLGWVQKNSNGDYHTGVLMSPGQSGEGLNPSKIIISSDANINMKGRGHYSGLSFTDVTLGELEALSVHKSTPRMEQDMMKQYLNISGIDSIHTDEFAKDNFKITLNARREHQFKTHGIPQTVAEAQSFIEDMNKNIINGSKNNVGERTVINALDDSVERSALTEGITHARSIINDVGSNTSAMISSALDSSALKYGLAGLAFAGALALTRQYSSDGGTANQRPTGNQAPSVDGNYEKEYNGTKHPNISKKTVRLEENGKGMTVRVKAKNKGRMNNAQIENAVSGAVQSSVPNANITIHQTDDRATIDHKFVSDIFSQALEE